VTVAFAVVDRMTLSRLIHVDISERMESDRFPKARAVDGAAASFATECDATPRAWGYVE
jgi:hypothetical protein